MEVPEYFEELIRKQFEHVHSDQVEIKNQLERILEQTTITNGRVRELENWRASSQGHWSGMIKTVSLIGSLIGGIIGVIVGIYFKS